MRNNLIMGSNGYIGMHLAKLLHSVGEKCVLSDTAPKAAMSYPGYEYRQVDVCNLRQIRQVLSTDVKTIYYFAGLTGTSDSFTNYEKYIDVNEKGLVNLLSVLAKKRLNPRIIFPSTRLVYEGQKDTPLDEDSPKNPKTVYAVSKLACEMYLKMYSINYGLNYTIFRIGVPYGNDLGGEYSYGTIGSFMRSASERAQIKLFGDGSLKRTFTHIKDIANDIVIASQIEETVNEIYNVRGETQSLKFVASRIAQKFNAKVSYVEWPKFIKNIESGDTIFDSSRLEGILSQPIEVDFDEWIRSSQL